MQWIITIHGPLYYLQRVTSKICKWTITQQIAKLLFKYSFCQLTLNNHLTLPSYQIKLGIDRVIRKIAWQTYIARPWMNILEYYEDEYENVCSRTKVVEPQRRTETKERLVINWPEWTHDRAVTHAIDLVDIGYNRNHMPYIAWDDWTTTDIRALVEDTVADCVLDLDRTVDFEPYRGLDYMTFRFVNYIKENYQGTYPKEDDIQIVQKHLRDLYLLDAIKHLDHIIKIQKERYKALIRTFARVYVDQTYRIEEVKDELRKQTSLHRSRWETVESYILHRITEQTGTSGRRHREIEKRIKLIEDQCFQTIISTEDSVHQLQREVKDFHIITKGIDLHFRQKIEDIEKELQIQSRRLRQTMKDVACQQERLNLEKEHEPTSEEVVQLKAPDYDPDIDEDKTQTEDKKEEVPISVTKVPIVVSVTGVLTEQTTTQFSNIPEERQRNGPPRHLRSRSAQIRRRQKYRLNRHSKEEWK